MVKFKKYIDVYDIEKGKYNFVCGRSRKEKRNRRLQRIEEYMRFHHLLFKNEHLAFSRSHRKKKHIRLPYIENISKKRGWIENNDYLIICS